MSLTLPEVFDLPSLDESVPCTWGGHREPPPPAEWRFYWKPWCAHILAITLYCQHCADEMFSIDSVYCVDCEALRLMKNVLVRVERL